MMRISLFASFTVAALAASAQPPPLQIAELGSMALESGANLGEVRLGYRIEGTLNQQGSNAIVFPTWFTGTTADLYASGSLDAVDTSRFYLISVDALGNGVSSSPSNTESFPDITIRDMVSAEYRLVTEVLGLNRLHAVIGISMGGMQTFEWITRYPGFMDKAVSIVGSPRLASYDVLLWETQLDIIALAREGGDIGRASELVAMVSALALQTPRYHARRTPRLKLSDWLSSVKASSSLNVTDRESQLRAMVSHDISRPFGGSMDEAAATVEAQLLNVVGEDDHMVTPLPALRFAELVGAESLVIDNDCGHLAMSCDDGDAVRSIRRFLESK